MKITTNTCPEKAAPPIESFFPTACAWGRLRVKKQERVALVDLDQLREDDVVLMLSEAERIYFQRFHHPKRRREWLCGRIAAKMALLDMYEAEEFRRLTLLPDEQGRPVVSGLMKSNRNLSLSITHSGKYAAALAVPRESCGIDLQKISDKLPSLINYFASETELKLLKNQSDLGSEETALTMLWAAKEAVKKSMFADQPGIFSGIEAQRISAAGDHTWRFECGTHGCAIQVVVVHDFAPYILALTEKDGQNTLLFDDSKLTDQAGRTDF
ncbi:4'-phosphopantetheinyl transferase superfamily protein [Desulfobulbus sp. F5]|nr:4'-phosphopantetheinyl transferase superfamily protein [Desulfobulbus sp. F5]